MSRAFIRFAFISVATYAALMLTWPIGRDIYVPLFLGSARVVNTLGGFQDCFDVQAEPNLPERYSMFDCAVLVHAPGIGDGRGELKVPVSLRNFVFAPIALFLAMCIASAIPWKEKRRMAMWAIVPLGAFIVGRISFLVTTFLVEEKALGAVMTHPLWRFVLLDVLGLDQAGETTLRLFRVWMVLLFDQTPASLLFPVVLWGILISRNGTNDTARARKNPRRRTVRPSRSHQRTKLR